MQSDIRKKRQFLIFSVLCLGFLGLILRLYYLQIVNYPTFKKKADQQHKILIRLEPKRGTVYDVRNGILALDIAVDSVYAVARDITDKENTASRLSNILSLDKQFALERLSRDKAFVWIKRKITDEESSKLKEANIEGVYLIKETKRSYPDKSLACQVIGFTDLDNNGMEGVELCYDTFLRGKYGWKSSFRDAKRKNISSYEEYLPARPGYNVVLTLDEVMQNIVENEIEGIVKEYRPKSVMIIAIKPDTGEVLAMATYPKFDLNYYMKQEKDVFKNRCISDSFEPGSVFKIVTASAVLEEGLVSFDDQFYCEQGNYQIGKRILHDYHAYGTLTFREVIEKSSNIGTVKAAAILGQDKLYTYIKKFGFGSVNGIDLPGEENGIIRPKDTWLPVDMTTLPMGQGISCTALQLVSAISAIANGGNLMKAFIVRRVVDDDGNAIKEFKPRVIRRVISDETASKMREILNGVVERGTGKNARLSGYTACGKTGTAQKVDSSGRYAKDKYVASFIGFAPYNKPAVAVAVCVNEPKGKHFGGSVAAPAFRNIVQKMLNYMEIPKDKDVL